jgi:hypothetical protein
VWKPSPQLVADIYEEDKLLAENIDFTGATKIVQAHNKELKDASSTP